MLMIMDFMSWFRKPAPEGAENSASTATLAAAESGDADAQFSLGVHYSSETGPEQDFHRAAEWYRKAADQGHALAQFNLGVMFATGQGVEKDEAAALEWTTRAAVRGDPGAQFALGTRCHRASIDRQRSDASESRVEAFKWFQLAANQGYKGASASRELVTLGMTREEVADGRQRAEAFALKMGLSPHLAQPLPAT